MKNKETLEEAAERIAKEHCNIRVNPNTTEFQIQQFIIKGAYWQAQRMYSKEEVNEIIAEAWNSCEDNEGETFTEVRKRILEQFKKK